MLVSVALMLLWMTLLAVLILRLIERRGRFTVLMLLVLMAVVAVAVGGYLWSERHGLPLPPRY